MHNHAYLVPWTHVCGVVHGENRGDAAIAEIARRQHGVVTRAQLGAIGLGRGSIAHRVAQGRLHRVHRGVYLAGHQARPPLARETAAVLACGAGAVLSHRSAAHLWGLPAGDSQVTVTIPARKSAHPTGVRVYRARQLDAGDVARRHGLPLTSPSRTVIDLAGALSERELERVFDEALRLRLVRREGLRAALDGSRGRRGTGVLRGLLDQGGRTLTRSEAEERLLALVRAARLPRAEVNVRVGRHEVDFLWRDARLVVEVDGFAYHSSRAAFERDRLRDAELQAAGFRVMRVTWRQISDEPAALVARLALALARS
jgi:very-short-patch-repair endonuclease